MAEAGVTVDPYRSYNFKCECQGITEAHFTRVTGLGVRVDAIAYREGGNNQIIRRLPGPVQYADVTLSYGLTKSQDMWHWFQTAMQGKVERRNVSIIMMDADGITEVLRWNLVNAWISEWQGMVLDALTKEVAIEKMTLVYDSLSRE